MEKFRFKLFLLAVFAIFMKNSYSQESVTLDYLDEIEPIEHVAAGLLHPFSSNGDIPADNVLAEVFDPLNIKYIRTLDVPMSIAKAPDANYIHTLGNVVWGKAGGSKAAPWEDWDKFDAAIKGRVEELRDMGIHPIYDFWNEPDGGSFDWPGANDDSLYLTYKHIYDIVRSTDPLAKVTGLGFENLNSGISKITDFIDYAIANNCVPDMWNWHFGGDNQASQIQVVKEYCRNAGIHDAIGIFEYLNGARVKYPGRTAWQISVLEENEVELAVRANFSSIEHHPGSLCGLLVFPTTDKRGTWWVYEQYGNMSGSRLNYTSSTQDIKVVATIDNENAVSEMIIGSMYSDVNSAYTGNVNFSLSNVKSTHNGFVKLTVQEIPYNNHGVVNFLPAPATDTIIAVNNNMLNFIINYTDGGSAYKVTISDMVQSDYTQGETVELTNISLSDTELTLIETRGKDLDAILEPMNTTENSVTWSSLDESIATVGQNGFVYPVKEGTTKIIVMNKAGTLSDTCHVTVTPFTHVTGISFMRDTLVIPFNDIIKADPAAYLNLSYEITPDSAMNPNVLFSSLDTDVIRITDFGEVISFKEGRAKLVVTSLDAGLSDTIVIYTSSSLDFNQIPIIGDSVLIDDKTKGKEAYDDDSETRFNNGGKLEDGWIQFFLEEKTEIDKIDIWLYRSDSRTYPIRVTINGKVVFDGESEKADDYWAIPITPTAGDTITVQLTGTNSTGHEWFPIIEIRFWNLSNFVLMDDLTLIGCVDSMEISSNMQFTTEYLPANTTDSRVEWYTDNPAIATVDETGTVEFIAPGEVTIGAKSLLEPELYQECTLLVYQVTDVAEAKKMSGSFIYPNPVTSNSFTIKSNATINNITVLDLNGRNIPFKFNNNTNRIEFTALQAGIYVLQFETENRMHTVKVVKE